MSYARGRQALDIDPTSPPSYGLTARGRELARNLTQALDGAAEVIANADPAPACVRVWLPRSVKTQDRSARADAPRADESYPGSLADGACVLSSMIWIGRSLIRRAYAS